jgi:hypothetical protein
MLTDDRLCDADRFALYGAQHALRNVLDVANRVAELLPPLIPL